MSHESSFTVVATGVALIIGALVLVSRSLPGMDGWTVAMISVGVGLMLGGGYGLSRASEREQKPERHHSMR